MTAKNDITGDNIKSKTSTEKYRENYDKIFRKDKFELPICEMGIKRVEKNEK
jgi:hypothetical protein